MSKANKSILVTEKLISNTDEVIPIIDEKHPFNYSENKTPPNYKCSKCGVGNVKLWRWYQSFLEHQELFCASCAATDQDEDISDMDSEGKHTTDIGKTDSIKWLVPAVPTETNDTFWGYTSVPEAGCVWWKRLPTFPRPVR